MKKAVIVLSTIYLTSCGITKPVVLTSAQMKPLNTIRKAYTNTNTRNGANDLEVVNYLGGTQTLSNGDKLKYYFQTYITPYNNPNNFNYEDDGRSTNENGNYRSFNTSLFFQTKTSIRLEYVLSSTNTTEETFENTITMELATNVVNFKYFKMYKLPYDTSYWDSTNGRTIYSYLYTNTLEYKYNNLTDTIILNPYEYTYNQYRNKVYNNQIYYWYEDTINMEDQIPPLEDPNANRLQTFYYYDFETLGAISFSWWNDLENYNYLSSTATEVKNLSLAFAGLRTQTENLVSYQYNATMSEELSAFNDGYVQGIDDAEGGVGTSWIQNVFRAIQSFLNIDFGFFKLAHVLGGMLVIAIVIFIVRWFR